MTYEKYFFKLRTHPIYLNILESTSDVGIELLGDSRTELVNKFVGKLVEKYHITRDQVVVHLVGDAGYIVVQPTKWPADEVTSKLQVDDGGYGYGVYTQADSDQVDQPGEDSWSRYI